MTPSPASAQVFEGPLRDWVIALAVLAAMAAVVGVCVWGYFKAQDAWFGRNGLVKKKLLTNNELDFYRKLLVAVGPRWTVLAQVSMGALIDTSLKPAHPKYWDVRNRFAQKICDFVLCDPKTLEPVLIIELDDVMHDFKKDAKRDTVAGLAGYQTIRFWSRNKPSIEELKQHIGMELALNLAVK
jgi:hypothetical protein